MIPTTSPAIIQPHCECNKIRPKPLKVNVWQKPFMVATFVFLTASTTSADLIHRWSFEGSTVDSVGAAHATLNGGATVSGGQLQLGGSSQYATLPIDATLSTLNSTTIEAWATYDALTPWGRIFDFGDGDRTGNPNQGYLALTGSPDYGNGAISFAQFTITQTTNTNSENLYGGSIPGPGVELHYAVVLDHVADIGTLYVNGESVLTQTITLSPADVMFNDGTEHNWLGRSRFNQDTYMNGSIEEFRIYNHALSSSQVLTSYSRGPNSVVPEPGASALLALGLILAAGRRARSSIRP